MDFHLRLCVLFSTLLFITACTGRHPPVIIDSYSPDNDQSLHISPDEIIEFTVTGVENSAKRYWLIEHIGDAPDADVVDISNGLPILVKNYIFPDLADDSTYTYELAINQEDIERYMLIKVTFDATGDCPDAHYSCAGINAHKEWIIQLNKNDSSKPIWNGGFVIYNDEDIQLLEGYNEITGSLYINKSKNLTQVDALSGLTTIGGNFEIYGAKDLKNIDGLSNVTELGGNLFIYDSNKLKNIDGLKNVARFENSISISSNNSLNDVTGLQNISPVVNSLTLSLYGGVTNLSFTNNITEITNNLTLALGVSMTELDGFNSLQSIGGDFLFSSFAITNIDNLNNLQHISGNFDLDNNNELKNIDGLYNLLTIDGDINIKFNDTLINLDGLSGLQTLGGDISISFNDSLTTLNGLSNIDFENKYILLSYNDVLTDIHIFEGLTEINGLSFVRNYLLTDLSIFSTLERINGALIVAESDITSLDFDNLTTASLIKMYSNSELCEQEVIDLATRLDLLDKLTSYQNKEC